MIVWAQLNDDGPDPVPKIAYQAPFLGTETRVTIPIAEIAPPDEAHLFCHRDCTDEATCPCLRDPKAGVGFVIVVPEGDAAPAQVFRTYVGIAMMTVGYSDKELNPLPPPQNGVYEPNSVLFPDGLEQGVAGYLPVRIDGGRSDRIGNAPPGTVFKLSVCDTTDRDACKAEGPNLN